MYLLKTLSVILSYFYNGKGSHIDESTNKIKRRFPEIGEKKKILMLFLNSKKEKIFYVKYLIKRKKSP